MSLLQIRDVSRRFGASTVLDSLSLDIREGERHALIGPNGAGKSTLFDLLSGRHPPSGGQILFRGQPIHGLPPHEIVRRGLARSFQVSQLFGRMSCFDNLRCALMRPLGYGLSVRPLLSRAQTLNARTEALLEEIGLQTQRNSLAGDLGYADQRALELGLTLASGADMLLLDEPVAGMSRSEADRAVALIRRVTEGRTLLLVEHDMGTVFELADRISVLAGGRLVATGTPEQIRGNPEVQALYLGSAAGGSHA